MADAYRPDPFVNRCRQARQTARELLPYLREDVRELLREIRRAEREISARWPSWRQSGSVDRLGWHS